MRTISVALVAAVAAGLATVAVPVKAADYTFRIGHTNAAGEIQDEGIKKMKERLEALTNGKATLQNFPNGQLGNEVQMVEQVVLGSLDMVVPSNAVTTNFVSEMKIFDMPFLFRDYAHMDKVTGGPILKELQPAAEKAGFKLLAIYSSGTRHIMTREPINSLADLKGRKIRTMQNPVHLEAFKAFGANATPMAYNELYGAIQTGVVDGAEAANTNYSAQKFYEVAKNWAMVGWLNLTANVLMSGKKFASLPPDIQKAVEQAALESAVWQRQHAAAVDKPLLDAIKAQGVKITTPDPEPFRKASEPVYAKFLTSDLDKKLLKIVQDAK